MSKPYKMHVISGTHWDREWRHTAEQSKPRLMDLVDGMIDTLEKHPEYKTYCLDGGMVVIEDYLTIRPEKKEKLKELIKAGRITVVNWYTLPESFTVSPEALLRNIKLGQMMAEEYGGAMNSGYTATGYGQTSQLPQIYQGFGIPNAIFYRGTNKHLLTPLFKWVAPDGSEIHTLRTFDEVTRTNWFFYMHQPLVIGKPGRDLSYTWDKRNVPVHICDETLYERSFKLLKEVEEFNHDEDAVKAAIDEMVGLAMPYKVGKHLLALNMEDNDSPFALLPEMIDVLNKVSPDVEFVQSSLDEYMKEITEDPTQQDLAVHEGELRYAGVEEGFNGLLGATHSSRVKLKMLNEMAETQLIFGAEPWAAIATALGIEYPKTSLDRAWQNLLICHAHDSICGAAVDRAHEDMLTSFSIVQMMSEEITARSTLGIFGKLNTAASFNEGDNTITVFNSLPYARKQVMPIVIDLPGNSAGEGPEVDGEVRYFDIVDENGNEVAYTILSKDDIRIAVERKLDTNGISMPVVRRKMLVELEAPAMGYKTYALRPRERRYVAHPQPGPMRKLLARESGVMENEHIKVQINPNGTFDLLHKETGHEVKNMHYFTDEGETGSAHQQKGTLRNFTKTTLGAVADITMVESNELRGVFKIEMTMKIPGAATLDAKERTREIVELPITTIITLEKDAKFLKIKTTLVNEARDHRLRLNFPTHIETNTVDVESTFDIETRDFRWTKTADNFEKHYEFQPMQNFVDVNDGKIGVAVLNKGLREYEVRDDEVRTIAITLLRCQRAYMTANGNMTTEELDKYTGQHSFGKLTYQYAVYPHQGDWKGGNVLQEAYNHKVPMTAIHSLPHGEGDLPATQSFFKLDANDKMMLSGLKQAEDGSGTVLRIWNITGDKVKATIETTLPVKSASEIKLDETVLGDLACKDGKISFECGPHKIMTILLRS